MIVDKFILKGKSGIITGRGTGLGKSMATALARAGAGVIIVGRRKDVLEKTAEELGQVGGPMVPFSANRPLNTVIETRNPKFEFRALDFGFITT